VRCRSFTGTASGRPSSLPPARGRAAIIAAIVVGVLLIAVICCAGIGFVAWRRISSPADVGVPTPAAAPTRRPSASPLAGAACLVGTWRETSNQSDIQLDGVTVRLNASGATQSFTTDGVAVLDLGDGNTKSGKHGGDTYTVVSTGKITFHYEVIGTQIRYSNARGTGSTVWKRNGKQMGSQSLTGGLGAETFTCSGDALHLFGDDYSIELDRVLA
jgi:hypothetical protein